MPRQIGYRLRRLRDAAGLTQAAAAAAAGISRSYLSAVENGRRCPPPAVLACILGALDADLDAHLTLQAELAERRGWPQALRGLLRRNPELAGLFAVIGPRRLSDAELGALGRCVGSICVAHQRLLQTQQTADRVGVGVVRSAQRGEIPPGGGEGTVA